MCGGVIRLRSLFRGYYDSKPNIELLYSNNTFYKELLYWRPRVQPFVLDSQFCSLIHTGDELNLFLCGSFVLRCFKV